MVVEGAGEYDKRVIKKISSEGKKIIKKLISDEEWKDVFAEIEETKNKYKSLGYSNEDIEIEEIYSVDFERTSPYVSKYVSVKNQHTGKRISAGSNSIYFISEDFVKKRNEIGAELKEMVDEAKEEIKEENHREDE